CEGTAHEATGRARLGPGAYLNRNGALCRAKYERPGSFLMGVDELLEPWAWDEQTWREHIARAAPGPRLPAVPWPGTCTAAFALSFDCDHETTALCNGHTSPGALAQGTYGAR